MTLSEYQQFTKKYLLPGNDLITFVLGLGGEAGEVLDEFKKARRRQLPPNLVNIQEELGDVLWYISNICNCCGLTIEQIIDQNVGKINKRYGGSANE